MGSATGWGAPLCALEDVPGLSVFYSSPLGSGALCAKLRGWSPAKLVYVTCAPINRQSHLPSKTPP